MVVQTRLKWIDNIKGIAMISVVLCHVVDGFYGAGLYPEAKNIFFQIRNFCNIFQMPLFCMASGYLFSKAYIGQEGVIKKNRLMRQIKNLASIYILWCFIMGLFKILLRGSVNHEVRPIDLALIWFKPIGVYWYLYVLIGLYIIFAKQNELKINNKVLCVVLLLISLCASLLVNYEGYLFAFRRIAYFGIIFFVGMLLANKQNERLLEYSTIGLGITSIVVYVLFRSDVQELYHIPIVNLIAALGFCLIIVWVSKLVSEQINLGILSLIGKNSLDVYLLHVFFAAGSRMLLARIGGIPLMVGIIGIFAISLFGPIIIGFLARKLGVYNLFFKPYMFFEKEWKNQTME